MSQRGQKTGASPAPGAEGPARQQNRPPHAAVRVVHGHSIVLHVKLADLRIRYTMYYGVPDWAEELVDYVEKHGWPERPERGYAAFEMEIPATKLLELVTSSDTWRRSPTARRIAAKAEELLRGHADA